MQRLLLGLLFVLACSVPPVGAAPAAWDTAYREFEGLSDDALIFLSVEVTQAPSVAAARVAMARRTSEEAVEVAQDAIERDLAGLGTITHGVVTVDGIKYDGLVLESEVSEPTLTYRLATVYVRHEAVLYIARGMSLGSQHGMPTIVLLQTLDAIAGRSGDHIRDLLPNVPDLPYPMRVVGTEIETPTPVGATVL